MAPWVLGQVAKPINHQGHEVARRKPPKLAFVTLRVLGWLIGFPLPRQTDPLPRNGSACTAASQNHKWEIRPWGLGRDTFPEELGGLFAQVFFGNNGSVGAISNALG